MTVQAAPTVRVRRSTAAQRAYDRRRQRASGPEQRPAASARPVPSQESSARRISARVPFVATIIALLCLGLATTLLLTTRAAEDSYELADARAHNQSLREQTAAVQREVAAGNSAPVLASKAAELGLIPAKDPARLVLGTDGAVAVVGTPKPAEGTPVPPLDRAPAPRTTAPAPPQQNTPAAPLPGQSVEGRLEARGEQPTPVTVVNQPPAGTRQ
ncbi:hypothetical protein [Prescottella sp. R16]|uniref:hypothetical protein n=1 Tax=Prescottella sp. R16 TaxID=3064529 RepID=UPI00272E3EB8|nr:hypothetical protein [Prescottella sp. R16]